MHIVIPMSGEGKRYLNAGYTAPKPLIEIDGKPMISHVVAMFPGESKFTFICNEEHLATTNMRELLADIAPNCNVVSIKPHKKGPVWAVKQAYNYIDDDEETIVNYCDFYSYWDYSDFLDFTRRRKAAGCVPSYKGFHPHMLGTDNYAFIRDQDQWLLEIQEKKPFTDNRMQEYASNGTYYFRQGRLIKKYFDRLIERNLEVNGEYYVSTVYSLLVEDQLPVAVYEVQHMLQWGTAKDLAEYANWSKYFRNRVEHGVSPAKPQSNSVTLLPMAGRGQRFRDAGIDTPKPLLNVSGKPMFIQAIDSLPPAEREIFVCLGDQCDAALRSVIESSYPNACIVLLDIVTEGQACSCAFGLNEATPPVAETASLMIGACDNGMIYDANKLKRMMEDPGIDAIALTFRNHPSSNKNPQMYGWVATESADSSVATGVSVKKALSEDPRNDHAIVGAFYFRNAKIFTKGLHSIVEKNKRVNGEFYVDTVFGELISLDYNCHVFEVDDYICWGTPDDWRVFRYWQSFFHKCAWHPYRIDLDPTADANDDELKNLVTAKMLQPCS